MTKTYATSKRGDLLATKLQFAKAIEGTYEQRSTCARLARIERKLQKLAEDGCNGHPAQSSPHMPIETLNKLQARWDARVERETAIAEATADKLAKMLGGTTIHQGDPRGAVLGLLFGSREFFID